MKIHKNKTNKAANPVLALCVCVSMCVRKDYQKVDN